MFELVTIRPSAWILVLHSVLDTAINYIFIYIMAFVSELSLLSTDETTLYLVFIGSDLCFQFLTRPRVSKTTISLQDSLEWLIELRKAVIFTTTVTTEGSMQRENAHGKSGTSFQGPNLDGFHRCTQLSQQQCMTACVKYCHQGSSYKPWCSWFWLVIHVGTQHPWNWPQVQSLGFRTKADIHHILHCLPTLLN